MHILGHVPIPFLVIVGNFEFMATGGECTRNCNGGAGLSVSKKNGVPWDSDLMTTKNNNRPELIFCDRGRGIKL